MLYYQYSIWFDSDRACIRFSGKTTKGMGLFLVCWHHHDYTMLIEFRLGKSLQGSSKCTPTQLLYGRTAGKWTKPCDSGNAKPIWRYCFATIPMALAVFYTLFGTKISFQYHFIWCLNIYIYIYDHKKSSDLSCHLHPSRHVAAPFQRWHQESWGFILPLPRPPGFRPFAERRVKPQPVTWEAAKSINWKRVFWARPWKLMVQVQMKFPGLGCKTYFQDLLGRVIEKSRNSKKHFFGERRKCYCSYQEGYI